MRTKNDLPLLPFLWVFLIAVLSSCNLPANAVTPTQGLNATQSFQTAVARVTQFYEETMAAQFASETPTLGPPTETPGVGTPSATPAPTTAVPTNTPMPCDKASPGDPIDVTIPDDTEVLPGQAFVKTWRLINSGTCTWTNSYALVWTSGEEMGDQNVVNLTTSVAPGQSVDLSVSMTAPTATGSYQSNWKLRNADGVLFGIGATGGSVFWVKINVVSPTATATATLTPTPTNTGVPTTTPTPVIQVNGTVNAALGDTLNLDNLALNGGGGDDLSYTLTGENNHLLSVLNGASMGVFGASKPGKANCQAASLGTAPLAIESLGVGTFLCYSTDAGRIGWFQISSFNDGDGALVLIVVTWALP